jgi:Ser/Thr protein kinase RdoA (MazF antagonist)
MTEATRQLATFIERQYATQIIKLHPLAQGWKAVYRVERADGPDWVVRAFPPPDDDHPPVSVTSLAALLTWLERQAYPAERVVKAADQSSVTQHGDWQVLITTFLHGIQQHWSPASGVFQTKDQVADATPVAYGVEVYQALGAALGRLHTYQTEAALPPAGMLPSRELSWVAGLLADVQGVPPQLQAQYEHLVATIQATSYGEDLPFTVIHNDPNLDNVVVTSAGEVLLIDWESAGLGPAVIDVGVILSNCFDKHAARIQFAAIEALVDGYCQYRRLSPAELDYLPAAIRFPRLVLLAGYFPQRADQSLGDDELIYGATYPQWQAQYAASAEIAAFARARFEQHSR